ncbi:N-acetyltransferase [Phytohabitans aurantiacus]|nr:N-acetyltransferase [Phytohabitans aurantiacus]
MTGVAETDVEIATVAERPEWAPMLGQLDGFWPAFMSNDPTAWFYYGYHVSAYPDFVLIAVDSATGQPMAKAHSVPIAWDGDPDDGLPDGGWDWVVRASAYDRLGGGQPTIVSALEILIRPDLRGTGMSGRMLAAMRDNAAKHGFEDLVAPVRPNGKHLHPDMPIDEYARWTRDDGLPVDPWLRVHVRAGGRIVNVAHTSMVIPARLERWREWTGLPFDTSGAVRVPQALSPVHCDVAQDIAVYVEPNVWVHHRLTSSS